MQISFDKEKLEMIKKFITVWKGFSRRNATLKREIRAFRDGGYLFFQSSKSGDNVELCMASPSKFYILNTEIFEERDFFCVDFKDLITLKFKNIVAGYLDTEASEVVFAEKGKKVKTIKIPIKKSEEDKSFVKSLARVMKIYKEDKEVCQCEVESIDLSILGAFKNLVSYFLKNQDGRLEIVQKEDWKFRSSAECKIKTGLPVEKNFLGFGIDTRDFLSMECLFGEKVKFSVLENKDDEKSKWVNLELNGVKVLSPSYVPFQAI